MMNQLNLTKIENRINRHFLEDGLLETIMGVWLMLMSTQIFFDFLPGPTYFLYMLLLPLSFGPGYSILRKRFTEPRIGYVKIKHSGSMQKRTIIIVFVGLLSILALGIGGFFINILINPRRES